MSNELHYPTQKACNDGANKRGNERDGDCVEKSLNFCLREIDCCDVEDCFTATKDCAGATSDVGVGPIGCNHVVEQSVTSASSKRTEKHEFAKLIWYSQE